MQQLETERERIVTMVAGSLTLKESYYTPLMPLVGTRLPTRRVAVFGLAHVASAAERLADCRVLRWQLGDPTPVAAYHPLARLWGAPPAGAAAGPVFAGALRERTPWEQGWVFGDLPALTEETYPAIRAALAAERPDLLL